MRRLAERLVGINDRDDVLHEALAGAWRNRSQFDETLGAPQSWLLHIVANHAHKAQRKARPVYPIESREPSITVSSRSGIDVERVIAQLSGRQRLAVELFYFVGLSMRDVAAAMGVAEGTAKSTLSDARTRMHSILGDDYQ